MYANLLGLQTLTSNFCSIPRLHQKVLPGGVPSAVGARLQEPSLLVLDYLGKWRLRGSETPPTKGTTESSHREPRLPGLSCLLKHTPVRQSEAVSRRKTRTPPECGAGSREPSCTGWGDRLEGSVKETHGARQRFLTELPARKAHRPCGRSACPLRCSPL